MALTTFDADLGAYDEDIAAAYAHLDDEAVMSRIWEHDHTVWQDDPTEIDNRLGWLHIMESMQSNIDRMEHLVHAVKEDSYTHVLLIGMGGSSLAPELFSVVYGDHEDGLWLQILDSTDPGAVAHYTDTLDPTKTLFIVATKSGSTAETLSNYKHFYNVTLDAYDGDRKAAGKHFIGITDPGSKLETISDRFLWRGLFLNDPNIGGRYSVLSYFGLIPAMLVGVDVETLLQRASTMTTRCGADDDEALAASDNPAARLGAIMGKLANEGRDKLTLVLSPQIEHFGEWAEQLIAESTGKSGTGILPVVGEPVGAPTVYGDDRLFVYLRLADDDTHDEAIEALREAGFPVVTLVLDDLYDLGGQFFMWELATAVAGHFLDIHPFNQPNVESAKVQARKMISEYENTGKLPELDAALQDDGITVYGDVDADSAAAAFTDFVAQDGAYYSLHVYVTPSEETTQALKALQATLRDKTKRAVTVGYGPRFLHSTGQLHKGDAGQGLFIQLLNETDADVPIPDEAGSDDSSMSFGTLKEAQALGDRQALLDEGRQVIRFRLADTVAGIRALTDAL